jgi:hypothetical protein
MHKFVVIVNKVSTELKLLVTNFEQDSLSDAGFDY